MSRWFGNKEVQDWWFNELTPLERQRIMSRPQYDRLWPNGRDDYVVHVYETEVLNKQGEGMSTPPVVVDLGNVANYLTFRKAPIIGWMLTYSAAGANHNACFTNGADLVDWLCQTIMSSDPSVKAPPQDRMNGQEHTAVQ